MMDRRGYREINIHGDGCIEFELHEQLKRKYRDGFRTIHCD